MATATAKPIADMKLAPSGNGDEQTNGKTVTSATPHTPAGKKAPRPLATPTDLTSEQSQTVADTVNPIIADHFALYIKTKNFHWHLASSHFRDYHLMLDEQADDIFDSIDVLAERVRKVGGTTIRSVGHVAQLTSIADDNDDYVAAPDMIRRLLEDNKASARKMRDAIDITEEARDTPTSNILQDILDRTEKRIWFLYQISTGGEHEN